MRRSPTCLPHFGHYMACISLCRLLRIQIGHFKQVHTIKYIYNISRNFPSTERIVLQRLYGTGGKNTVKTYCQSTNERKTRGDISIQRPSNMGLLRPLPFIRAREERRGTDSLSDEVGGVSSMAASRR
ncbi:uncharacterized protein [Drosophila virilis]|uniref:uncharacterized protein isoform X1 n=1 Tax=Drosophila virilis TaxID=7244 RepID=UPI0013964EC4|nr:uncharacterized protein LOC116649923 isoform X1 [Drosophila virilis]XP_032289097.1 uncharacterized protein LOC116649924 isoform X1 [Drosophila virilis]